tara:strand:- start:126 stop:1124 length:999 start_codon:yes stop_codon:yes gene_type:complete
MDNLFFDKDVSIDILKPMKVGIIGYGNQGRAQALNLKDSGIDIVIGLRENSSSIKQVIDDNLSYLEISEVVRQSDIISILIPDQVMSGVYNEKISRYLKPGKVLLFSHGYNITYKEIVPPHFVDIVMVAPSGPGYAVREEYKKGRGVPTLVAINQNITGKAKDIVLAYSKAIGGTRSCCFVSNFKEETETDLFGEQMILTGIIPSIINESFKVLLEAGYSPVVSWFVSFYEVKQISDLLSTMSIDEFYNAVSDTAEYGGISRSNKLISSSLKDKMRNALDEIQSGEFHKEWKEEAERGYKELNRLRGELKKSPINDITRDMLNLINKNKKNG